MSGRVRYLTGKVDHLDPTGEKNRANRAAVHEHNFRWVWLRLSLGEVEYAETRELALPILQHLYQPIWEAGPHAQLWAERADLLNRRLTQLATGSWWSEGEEIEFNRQVFVAFCEQRGVHGNLLNGFASRYERSMLPNQYGNTAVYQIARHTYWQSQNVRAWDREPRIIGEGRSYWPFIAAQNIHRSTLGLSLLAEMGERSRHARELLRLHEAFWVWLAATDRQK